MKHLLLLGLALVLASGVALVAAAMTNGYEIPRWVIGGGGGESAAGDFYLVGTVGQPVTGLGSEADYNVCSGFWCGAGWFVHRVYLPLVQRDHP